MNRDKLHWNEKHIFSQQSYGQQGLGVKGNPLELIDAIKRNDASKAQELLLAGNDPDERDALARTALHYAATFGHVEIVSDLILCSANVNLQDAQGYTPLYRAALSQETACVKLLLDAGADPTIKAISGRNARGVLIATGQASLLEKED